MKKLMTVFIVLASFAFASPAFGYTVKSGDTMSKIARDNGLSLKELARANPQIKNLDYIVVGETVHTDVQPVTATKSVSTTAVPADNADPEKLTKQRMENNQSENVEVGLSDAEIDLLARIVRAEAQTEPFEGKVAVADVVLNRVESSKFPNTVKEVIYAPGQFQPVANGEIHKPADEESIEAVFTALTDNGDIAQDALFFYNPTIATNRWLDSRETVVVIGQHVFKN
ncbi:MAG: cell wall hydrolase [Bacillota bacterium]